MIAAYDKYYDIIVVIIPYGLYRPQRRLRRYYTNKGKHKYAQAHYNAIFDMHKCNENEL